MKRFHVFLVFLGMSSNGIAGASSGDLSESSNQGQPGNCSQCGKDIPCTKSAVAWETMVYCDENCLGKYQDKMNNCSTCKVHVQTAFLGKYIILLFGPNRTSERPSYLFSLLKSALWS